MIRRCRMSTKTQTDRPCEIVPCRRATTRGSTVRVVVVMLFNREMQFVLVIDNSPARVQSRSLSETNYRIYFDWHASKCACACARTQPVTRILERLASQHRLCLDGIAECFEEH